jgi:tRNA pseudouridine(55) synthase
VAQFRTRKAALDGILLIDKPEGLTSHDVVARVRRLLRPGVKKVGHAGTLDPFATGLLVVLVGRATKLARFFVDLPKEYECTMQFGVRSDTGDGTGALEETRVTVTREAVEGVLPQFIGTVLQRVPMTSAVKVDGERLYKKAHRGEVVETPVKQVEIAAIDVLEFDDETQRLRCRIACSKGTYVRQLAIDVGEAVAAGAHALFFPHGLGHMIGLDVHDLENLGEQYVGYEPGVERSQQFGLGYLRLARKLKPGFVLTVEPGLYFIPQLIDQWKAEKRNAAFINYKEVEKFRNARGYRIEDDVLVTKSGGRVLGPPIPKTVADVEAACKG